MLVEKDAWYMSGFICLLVLIVLMITAIINLFYDAPILAVSFILLAIILASGLTIIKPNEAIVVLFLGSYVGTVRKAGFIVTIPFSTREKVSLQKKQLNSSPILIPDREGEVYEVIVNMMYRVVDTVKANYHIQFLDKYIQSETEITLRENALIGQMGQNQTVIDRYRAEEEWIAQSMRETNNRLKKAGIELIELRIVQFIQKELS